MTIRELSDLYKLKLASVYDEREAVAIAMRTVEEVCGMQRAEIYANMQTVLKVTFCDTLLAMLDQLQTGKPIQYVLGYTEFYGRRFELDNNVLIPRPETEELVQAMIKECKGKKIDILDIGTGSGCIAVSLACELPESEVKALDFSAGALEIAKKNALINHANVDFALYDMLDDSPLPFPTPYAVVSNPPYVCDSEKKQMHANVLEFEPHSALFVRDGDPLLFYKVILKKAKGTKLFMFEINEALGDETAEIFIEAGYKTEIIKDLFGKDRIVKAVST